MKKAIVVGATSGIGRELAIILSRDGYCVGLAGRRQALLDNLKKSLPGQVFTKQIDVADHAAAMIRFQELIDEMNGVDLVIISAGTGALNPELNWHAEKMTIDVNVAGFTAIADIAFRHFEQKRSGHLVGISSVATVRGNRIAPAYNATKAYISNYLEGLRFRAMHAGLPIAVTDIKPGFVNTAMAKGEGLFWVASPQEAARQAFRAIQRKRKRAYVTRRWRFVAWLFSALPDKVFARF